MSGTVHLPRARRERARHSLASGIVGAALAATVLTTACGGDDAPTAITPNGGVTGTLVGSWAGSVNGTFGPALLRWTLAADSTIVAESPDNPRVYCRMTGTWRITGSEFLVSGRDCDGVAVTLTAPASSTRMTGVWSGSNGSSGTFTATKQ